MIIKSKMIRVSEFKLINTFHCIIMKFLEK